jgi:hypothetical protein
MRGGVSRGGAQGLWTGGPWQRSPSLPPPFFCYEDDKLCGLRSDNDDDDDDDDELALTRASFIIMAFGELPFGPFLGRLDWPSRMFFFGGTGGFLGPLSSSF